MDPSEPIVCRVTGWFYRRTILPGCICLAIAAWFFYDGLVVYPARMRIYQEYRAYQAQRTLLLLPASDSRRAPAEREWAKLARTYPDFSPDARWSALAQRYGWPETDPPEWPVYARTKGYFEQPVKKDRVLPFDITGQFATGALFLAAAFGFLVNALLASRRALRADAEGIRFPNGKRVPFDRIVRVDNRKWADQGLSRLEWKAADGQVKAIRLDCLKYDEEGAERIMARILARPGIEVLAPPG